MKEKHFLPSRFPFIKMIQLFSCNSRRLWLPSEASDAGNLMNEGQSDRVAEGNKKRKGRKRRVVIKLAQGAVVSASYSWFGGLFFVHVFPALLLLISGYPGFHP